MGDRERLVLVAEAEASLRGRVERWLLEDGQDVLSVASGLEALELARAHKPRVIVLSENLPWLDGHEVARAIRRDSALQSTKILGVVDAGPRLRGAPRFNDCDSTVALPLQRDGFIAIVGKLVLEPGSATRIKAAVAAPGVLGWLQIGRR
jgi:CheY-like chemotaxis protein